MPTRSSSALTRARSSPLRQPSSRCRISQRRGSATPSPPGASWPSTTTRPASRVGSTARSSTASRSWNGSATSWSAPRPSDGAVIAPVVGAAGVGKSRLVHELLDGLAGQATVLSGRCVAYAASRTGRSSRSCGMPAVPRRSHARSRARTTSSSSPRLEAAGGLSSATFTTDEIFWAVRRFVELNARERPVVLVVDDAHWAEPTFHDLVDYLAAFVTQVPVSLIRLGRPELLDHRPAPPGTETIELGPLVETDAEALLAGVERRSARGRRSSRSPRGTRSSSSSSPRSPPTRPRERFPSHRRSKR